MTSAQPKPFAFVLMPFSTEFRDIYEVGIKQACIDAGAYCERVDEQIFYESMLERIYNQISKADIIISDMTGRNPNVFYETGYAHALGKRVILLTQDGNDIPFDLKHHYHIVYGGQITTLRNELRRRVQWFIENPETAAPQTNLGIEFYLNGRKITEGCTIEVTTNEHEIRIGREISGFSFEFRIDIHNPTDRIIDTSALDIGIIVPTHIESERDIKSIKLPDSQRIYLLPKVDKLLPSAWDTRDIGGIIQPHKVNNDTQQIIIRVFREFGPSDTTFKLFFKPS